MSLEGIRIRTKLIQEVRSWLLTQDLEEVVPTLSSQQLLTEPTIYPFYLKPNLWLNTSGERWLKLLMAQGLGNCFSIAQVFRDMEFEGDWHQPEFLMLEWYHHNKDLHFQRHFCQKFVIQMAEVLNSRLKLSFTPWPEISLNDLWLTYIGVSINQIENLSKLKHLAQSRGYQANKATWEELFNQITIQEIYPHLPAVDPFFLTDYPAVITPLGKPKEDNAALSERFELFVGRIEIANATVESFDRKSIETSLEKERQQRMKQKLMVSQDDKPFLEAISTLQDQKWSGIGLGIERLGAILTGMPMRELMLL